MGKVLILGSSSLLSKKLAESLIVKGHQVALAGRNSKPNSFDIESEHLISTQEFDVVIFVSWIQSPRNNQNRIKNEQAVEGLVKNLTEKQKFVFISSQAASRSARSQYGKGKYTAELAVKTSQRYLIIRPATIIENAKLRGEISNSLIANLLTKNENFLAPSTVKLETLTNEIVNKLENSEAGTFEITSSQGWKSNSLLISQIIRSVTWPLLLFRGDFADRTLSYIDLKFPTH